MRPMYAGFLSDYPGTKIYAKYDLINNLENTSPDFVLPDASYSMSTTSMDYTDNLEIIDYSIDSPRLNSKGLLMERARGNRVANPRTLDNWTKINVAVTDGTLEVNDPFSPQGNLASKVQVTVNGGVLQQAYTMTSGDLNTQPHHFEMHFRKGNTNYTAFLLGNSTLSTFVRIWIRNSDGVIELEEQAGSSPTISKLEYTVESMIDVAGETWWRIRMRTDNSDNPTTFGYGYIARVYPCADTTTNKYNPQSGEFVYLVQPTIGQNGKFYTPATQTNGTSNLDVVSSHFASQYTGKLTIEPYDKWIQLTAQGTDLTFYQHYVDANNYIHVWFEYSSQSFKFTKNTAGTIETITAVGSYTVGEVIPLVWVLSSEGMEFSVRGVDQTPITTATAKSGITPVANVQVGYRDVGGLNGADSYIKYFEVVDS